jgi:hypothetical protein
VRHRLEYYQVLALIRTYIQSNRSSMIILDSLSLSFPSSQHTVLRRRYAAPRGPLLAEDRAGHRWEDDSRALLFRPDTVSIDLNPQV